MAKIGLTEGFTLIPEGTHVFQITDVKYKEDFGKLEVYMQTQTGNKHIERFSLLKSDGSPNEGAQQFRPDRDRPHRPDWSLHRVRCGT